ncbi:MAG: Na/Pi cotransporter family protein [Firmicutes bacterium]|nr:Na/Pi cotransporter family protein [Bacillota bacterium]
MGSVMILSVIGGMGLLLYGMYIMSEALQKIAGHRLRDALGSIAQNRVLSLIMGALITVLFQSSTATTVILVGLVNATIITLKQTLGIILGADIGTAVTAQLIALKVTEIALPVVGFGAIIIFFAKRDKYRRIGQAFLGFGLLFLGLKIMADAMSPLRDSPFFTNLFLHMSDNPLLAIFTAAVFTFLVHSSAATIGIMMVLAMQGMLPLVSAIYLIYGANIGTSFTAVLSSLSSTREAQRVAAAHVIFKVAGVLLFLPFSIPFAKLLASVSSDPGFQVANAHTFFNIAIAVIFLPFTNYFAVFLEKILPAKKGFTGEPIYLDDSLIGTPSIAIGLALKEVIYISDNALNMLKEVKMVLESYSADRAESILKLENRVDQHTLATRYYLTRILRNALSREDFTRCLRLINIVNELEKIGDVIEKDLLYLAESKEINNAKFSEEGKRELELMYNNIYKLANMVNNIIMTNDSRTTYEALCLQEEITDLEFRSRISHIQRLSKGISESENSSAIHLELINAYLRIGQHLFQIIEIANDPEILDTKNMHDFYTGDNIFDAAVPKQVTKQ